MQIVYVEDNPANLLLVQRIARAGGHEVINYTRGEDVLAQYAKDNPDLVLMDVQLEGPMTGLDVVRALRASGYKTPIYAVTAYAMVGDKEKCLEAGCTGYLAKPLPVTLLVELFNEYAAQVKAQKQQAASQSAQQPAPTPTTPQLTPQPTLADAAQPSTQAAAQPPQQNAQQPAPTPTAPQLVPQTPVADGAQPAAQPEPPSAPPTAPQQTPAVASQSPAQPAPSVVSQNTPQPALPTAPQPAPQPTPPQESTAAPAAVSAPLPTETAVPPAETVTPAAAQNTSQTASKPFELPRLETDTLELESDLLETVPLAPITPAKSDEDALASRAVHSSETAAKHTENGLPAPTGEGVIKS